MMAGIIINHDVTVPKSDWKSQEAEKDRNQSVLGTGHWDWSVFFLQIFHSVVIEGGHEWHPDW